MRPPPWRRRIERSLQTKTGFSVAMANDAAGRCPLARSAPGSIAPHVLVREDEADLARRHGQRLLADVGLAVHLDAGLDHPAVSWVRSGLSAVTGRPGGGALMAPTSLTAVADGALAALAAISTSPGLQGLRGSALLGERARLCGLQRQGAISPGGGSRLLPTAGGMVAVSLVRESDWDLVPAWLEAPLDDWASVAMALATRPGADVLDRGRMLGLAVADAAGEGAPGPWFETCFRGAARPRPRAGPPLVIDLSALWAGPLCADLLGRMGSRVIKVESRVRPDGARAGAPEVYDRLNSGKSSLCLDFNDRADLAALRALMETADIVIESSRPRALRQLGLRAEDIIARNPGLTWIAISGHGRDEPQAGWTGFGDDAAVAAGLSRLMKDVHGDWLFCGDAIADPLTGLHAAVLAWASWMKGGGQLHAISLRSVISAAIAADAGLSPPERQARTHRWTSLAAGADTSLYGLAPAREPAEALGASTRRLLGAAC